MKFVVSKTSDWDYKSEVNIETIGELLDFIHKNGPVIIGEHYNYDFDGITFDHYNIEIYDDWRE